MEPTSTTRRPRSSPPRPVDPRRAIGVTLLALLILALGFLPWATADVEDMDATVTLSAWNGHVALGPDFPNALTVLAAIALAVLCWLRRSGVWTAPGVLLAALTTYGLVHLAVFVVFLAYAEEASVKVGGVLSLATWIAIATVLLRTRAVVAPASAPTRGARPARHLHSPARTGPDPS